MPSPAAIVIGNPDKNKSVIIRVHSSCYTGDLLNSLKCDCRDQLHEAIKYMESNGGGVILYLMQEGRGIGLVNKLRAYKLQSEGMDTVDANEFLGFDDDERPFEVAVKMLKILGIKKVRLLSNNPRKAKELQKLKIIVTELIPIITEHHEHVIRYLKTKSERLGHQIKI